MPDWARLAISGNPRKGPQGPQGSPRVARDPRDPMLPGTPGTPVLPKRSPRTPGLPNVPQGPQDQRASQGSRGTPGHGSQANRQDGRYANLFGVLRWSHLFLEIWGGGASGGAGAAPSPNPSKRTRFFWTRFHTSLQFSGFFNIHTSSTLHPHAADRPRYSLARAVCPHFIHTSFTLHPHAADRPRCSLARARGVPTPHPHFIHPPSTSSNLQRVLLTGYLGAGA